MLSVELFKRQLDRFALDVPQLTLDEGELFVILGPTGAGKSRLLEAIAGFAAHQGRVVAGGRDVSCQPPEARGISLLFQEAQLFPHLDVRANICFARTPAAEEWKALVESLQLESLLEVDVTRLSGGQRQLVALARALAAKPRVLLLDEPFSAIDPMQRRQILDIFSRVQAQQGITSLLVTHNFEEAITLGHRIGIMHEGRLCQVGTPETVFQNPATPRVARFLGAENLYRGEIERLQDEPEVEEEPFPALFRAGPVQLRVLAQREGPAHVLVHPYEITLLRQEPFPSSALNQFSGEIVRITAVGALARVRVQAGLTFIVEITQRSRRRLELEPGVKVFLTFKAASVKVFQ